MAGNARFHDKIHRKNHHTLPTLGYADSATDPIASHENPFQGDFVINGTLSTTGGLDLLSAYIRSDLFCENLHVNSLAVIESLSGSNTETIISDGSLTGNGNNTLTIDYGTGVFIQSPVLNVNNQLSVLGNVYGAEARFSKLYSYEDVTIDGNILINGNLSALGDVSVIATNIIATSSLEINNHGTNTALVVNQTLDYPIASFNNNGDLIVEIIRDITNIYSDLYVSGNVNSQNINQIQNNINYFKDLSSNWQSTLDVVTSISANWQTGFNYGTVYSNNSSNYERIYTEAFTVGSTPAISSWNDVVNTVNTYSGNWESVFNNVNTYSADWSNAYTSVNTYSGDWQTTRTTLESNSSNYERIYNEAFTVGDTPAISSWNEVVNTVNSYSANWESVFNNVNTYSADWSNTFTSINTYSGDWLDAKTTLESNSSKWEDNYSITNTYSGDWNNTFTSVNPYSGDWNNTFTSVNTYSGDWNTSYTTVCTQSAYWDLTYNSVFAVSVVSGYTTEPAISSWTNSVNILKSNSANWQSVYNILSTNSAYWMAQSSLLEYAVSWDSSYLTVYQTSAYWEQAYNSITTLENVSSNLSEISGRFEQTWSLIGTKSGKWEDTSLTVQNFSAEWLNGGDTINLSAKNLRIYGATQVSVSTISSTVSAELYLDSPTYWFINPIGTSSITIKLPFVSAGDVGLMFSIKNTYNGGGGASDLNVVDNLDNSIITLYKIGTSPSNAQLIWDGTIWQTI